MRQLIRTDRNRNVLPLADPNEASIDFKTVGSFVETVSKVTGKG